MEIRHLKLVKTVAEEGNLTNAGKKLFLSQSALSHQLREIEDKFGTPIFQRVNKKMVLTQVGNRILSTAETILCELEKALGGIFTSVQHNVFDRITQFTWNVLVDGKLPCVDDPHIHARLHGVVEKN